MKLFTLLLAFLFTLVVSEDFVILKPEECISKYNNAVLFPIIPQSLPTNSAENNK